MKPENYGVRMNRMNDAIDMLEPKGWVWVREFFFFKGGKVYDLSAADLDQVERIEREGLCIYAE